MLLVGVCKSVPEAFNFNQQELKEGSFGKCVYPSFLTLKILYFLPFRVMACFGEHLPQRYSF